MELLITIGAAVVGVIVLALVLKALWRVAEPNEALIISGFRARSSPGEAADSLGFKIVTGKGTMVLPGFQAARRLSLDTRGTSLQVSCVTKQGIPVAVRGVVIYKVGDDFVSIANAARRFLDQQNTMNDTIHELFAGHLRSICGGLTIEDMIHNREALTGEVRRSSADEMSKLGLVIDSLQIQEIDDASGYITNLGKPHAAAIAASARIAEAQRDQEATEAEQIAEAKKAAAIRDSRIQQAGYQAEIDEASAKATQAGPLSQATARQEVVVQETRAAQLEADLAEQRLQSQVRKPADAKAYELRTLADAERDAQIARAQAQARETELAAGADATRVKTAAQAEAEATKARGEAAASATRLTGEADADAARARGLAEADAAKARGWPRPRPSRPARTRSRRTRRPSSPSSSPRTGRRSSGPARGHWATSTTWWCSTAPTGWPTCSPRPLPWAAPGSASPASSSERCPRSRTSRPATEPHPRPLSSRRPRPRNRDTTDRREPPERSGGNQRLSGLGPRLAVREPRHPAASSNVRPPPAAPPSTRAAAAAARRPLAGLPGVLRAARGELPHRHRADHQRGLRLHLDADQPAARRAAHPPRGVLRRLAQDVPLASATPSTRPTAPPRPTTSAARST